MQRILFLILFVITSQVSFSQFFQPEIYFESNCLPDSSGGTCFVSYRIAYNHLVFVKEDGIFSARFSVTAEAEDSLTGKYFREIEEKTIKVSSYEETSIDNKYVQGVIKLKLPNGNYKITPIINDYNAGKELRFHNLIADLQKSGKIKILSPVVVSHKKKFCNSDSLLVLANIKGDIPFSLSNFDIIIPVADPSITQLELQITNNDSLLSKITVNNYSRGIFEEGECQDIYFKPDQSSKALTFFYVPDINLKLQEGKIVISVAAGGESKIFNRLVYWQNKPKSLRNAQYAVKILKYIADESEIDKLNSGKDEVIYRALVKYWKKFDPTPGTGFNELMSEYYERTDYANENFSVIGTVNGAETDRGKIYIQFGKPDDIRRVYSNSNDIKEIWKYNSSGEQFIFTDKSGMGNFILSDNL